MKKARLKKHTNKSMIQTDNNEISIKYAVITVIIMLIILVGFYFLTEKILKKTTHDQEETQEVVQVRKLNSINYSDVENMVASSYYLLIDKADDENNDSYDLYINSLKYNKFPIEFYYIDLADEHNKDLLAKEEKLEDLKNLKVKDTTLVYVSEGKIKETYVGGNSILSYLSSFFSTSNKSNDTSNKDESKDNKSNKDESHDNKEDSNKDKSNNSDDNK